MKSALVDFFSSSPVVALATAIAVFLITIFLVARRWIGFSTALIFLLFALSAAVLINNPKLFDHYTQGNFTKELEYQETFNKQILQAIEGMKGEIQSERENIQQLKGQVQDIISQLDSQKQKVENFIEEARKHFQPEEPPEPIEN